MTLSTFSEFMAEVDRHLKRISGLSHMDLADIPFRDRFDDGVDPEEVAIELLEEEGFPF